MTPRYAVALLLLAGCAADPAPRPSAPPGMEPGSRPWANQLCADAWHAQGSVPKHLPHTVEGFPTTAGRLAEWREGAVAPAGRSDAPVAVCLYTGEFGETPPHRSLTLFVSEDGSAVSGVELSTSETPFPTPPPAPG